MSKVEAYIKIFTEVFSVQSSELDKNFRYQSHPNWDSLGHMTLIAALESEYAISMDMDDVIDFDSFEKGKEILSKYDVDLS